MTKNCWKYSEVVTDFSTSSHLTFDSEKWLKDEKDVCECAGRGIAVSAIWKQYKVPSICHDLRGFLWDLMQQEPDRRKQWLTQNYSIWFRWDSDKIPLKWPYLYEWGMEVRQDSSNGSTWNPFNHCASKVSLSSCLETVQLSTVTSNGLGLNNSLKHQEGRVLSLESLPSTLK